MSDTAKPAKRPAKRMTPARRKALRMLERGDVPVSVIAKRFGIARSTLYSWLRRYWE